MWPASPAWGLRPATASRGRAMAKSRRSAAAVVRATRTIASVDSVSSACRSDTWIVTGTTRRLGPASIIASDPDRSVSAARYSVWPG